LHSSSYSEGYLTRSGCFSESPFVRRLVPSHVMKKYALIVAGGEGKRMGSDIPKQFISVAGLPILMHTLTAFYRYDQSTEIILVLPVSHFNQWTNLSVQYDFDVSHKLVAGGSTRFHSVKNGLNSMSEDGFVAIHDGVRPLVDVDIIARSFNEAEVKGNAVVAVELKDTIRRVNGGTTISEDRTRFRLIQTPQTFRVSDIRLAYSIEYNQSITDDASVAELAGIEIHLTSGNYRNIKITTEEDLIVAEAFFSEGK